MLSLRLRYRNDEFYPDPYLITVAGTLPPATPAVAYSELGHAYA